jgi:hypothetical protein
MRERDEAASFRQCRRRRNWQGNRNSGVVSEKRVTKQPTNKWIARQKDWRYFLREIEIRMDEATFPPQGRRRNSRQSGSQAASSLDRKRQTKRQDSVISGRIRETDRQSSSFSLKKAVNKAIDNSREKATRRILLSSEDSKLTGRVTDKVASSL